MFKKFLFSSVLLTFPITTFANCLDNVSEFADKICGQIEASGSNKLVEANGELKAEVSGIVRKILGKVGGSINGKATTDAYENVLREDLPKELFNIRECRIKMVEVGRAELCQPVGSPSNKFQNKITIPEKHSLPVSNPISSGDFCCDSKGNHRCPVPSGIQIGTSCFCLEQGEGIVCN